MIYNYIFVKHRLIKAQSFVNYIVLEILCKVHKKDMPDSFDENIVEKKYKALIKDINPLYIKTPINQAYKICKKQNNSSLMKLLKKALHVNINIQGICEGKVKPVLYSDLKEKNRELANAIYLFCTYLYKEVLKLKPCIDLYGEIKDHYSQFSIRNGFRNKRCPFCGSTRMENEFSSKRETYDHYFPKEQYPFISIHFANLIPMCYKCNTLYKRRKNPIDINKNGNHKKVFYPYYNYGKINFSIKINNVNLEILKKNEIEIKNELPEYEEEVNSWENIFDIIDRYKNIYVGDAFTWFEEVRIATGNFGITYNEHKANLSANYYNNENFMKLALLEACEEQKIL